MLLIRRLLSMCLLYLFVDDIVVEFLLFFVSGNEEGKGNGVGFVSGSFWKVCIGEW